MKLMNKEMPQQQQRQILRSEIMVGRPPTGKKKKDKNIKVTEEVHKELGQIGHLTEDYGDVVERLIKFYREHGGKE